MNAGIAARCQARGCKLATSGIDLGLNTPHPQQLFAALAEATRLLVVRLLAQTGEEACLCELVDSLLEPQYKLSRHLKELRQAGVLSAEREGRWIYHRLAKRERHLRKLYAVIRSLPDPDKAFQADEQRFRERICLREDGRCRVGIQTKRLMVSAS